MSVRRQISLAASAGKGGNRANARVSAAPCAPSTRGSKIRRMRQSSGKFIQRDHRRDLGARPSARIDRQAPALEQCNPHARTRAAIEQARIFSRVEGQARQSPKRRRDRQRELSPGAEPSVRGNGVRDDELLVETEAKAFGDAPRHARGPLALLAQNLKARRFAKLNAGLERVDGKTNRSKPAAKISAEIEKTQMQSRRRRDLNAFQRAPLYPRSLRRLTVFKRVRWNFAKLCAFCQAPHATNCATACSPVSDLRPSWRLSCNADQVAMLRWAVQNATVAW